MKLRRSASTEGEVGSGAGAPATPHRAGAAGAHEAHLEPLPPHSGPRLGEVLLREGAIDEAQLDTALQQQDGDSARRLGAILMDLGAVDERTLTRAIAHQYGMPYVDLRLATPDREALDQLSGDLVRELDVLPNWVDAGTVGLAVARPPTPDLQRRLEEITGKTVRFALTPPSELARSIDRYYRALDNVGEIVQAFERGEQARPQVAGPDISMVDQDSPVVQVVTRMLTQAVRDRASDVHIEPTPDAVRVRFRVDGSLYEPLQLPATMAQALVSRIKIMADMNIVERRRAQDGQFEFEADGRHLDVRVATVATISGEKAVLRILDRDRSLITLGHLGMPDETADAFSRHIRSPFGMVICAGPTGSGKTTTLYAALTEISDPERNVTTIEDPVEYVFPSINQIQINEAADVTFAGGLKAILRQDPDIILVGEMRDLETTRIAVQSALTGHLVLSSLHATDAAAAMHRFLDMGIEPFLVASSVIAVVGQRLVRHICPHCRTEYVPPAEELAFYEESGGAPKEVFLHGAGCNFCSHTGYSDRVGVFELLRVTEEVKDLILERAPYEKVKAVAISQGMRTLVDEGIRLVENDVTTISEVVRRIWVS